MNEGSSLFVLQLFYYLVCLTHLLYKFVRLWRSTPLLSLLFHHFSLRHIFLWLAETHDVVDQVIIVTCFDWSAYNWFNWWFFRLLYINFYFRLTSLFYINFALNHSYSLIFFLQSFSIN